MSNLILNIEADEILYRSAFAVEKQAYKLVTPKKTYDFGNKHTKSQIIQKVKTLALKEFSLEGYKITEPLEHAIYIVKSQLKSLNNIGALNLWLSPSNGSNFRFKLAKTPGPKGLGYKANRPARPLHYASIREYLIKHWGAQEIDGFEADDALGMYQTDNTIASHIDKDISMIEGKHYHWVKQERYVVDGSIGVLPMDGQRGTGKAFFFHQMLTGDNVDNIPGIPNIGPVKSSKLLSKAKTEKEMLAIITEMYYNYYKDEYKEKLYEIANLLYIVDNQKRNGEDYLNDLR